MPLNLVTDAWIPVIRHGSPITIRPHEIAVEGVERLNWPRDDLNLACLELLIGLVYLADPPRDDGDWHDRYGAPRADRLRGALECFGPHVELTGNGPRFLQDLEPFEARVKRSAVSPPDMLFVDSAGANTARNNRDLMVKRNRYASLPLPLAAMSLYTLQAFAPGGGAGNRTSMRGGGPLVTLVKPLDADTYSLWQTVWCNVPEGQPLAAEDAAQALPWLRPTRTSEKGTDRNARHVSRCRGVLRNAEATSAGVRERHGDRGRAEALRNPLRTLGSSAVALLLPGSWRGASAGSLQTRQGQFSKLPGTRLWAGRRAAACRANGSPVSRACGCAGRGALRRGLGHEQNEAAGLQSARLPDVSPGQTHGDARRRPG